jgi:membrane protein YdbS with pleckstrin-like domain
MKFSELSSREHHRLADAWRARIHGATMAGLTPLILMMVAFWITKSTDWVKWSAVVALIYILAIGLMFIPLIRHNRKNYLL